MTVSPWLTKPLTPWLRLPVYAALLAGLGALGYLYVTSHYADRLESVATARLIEALRMVRREDTLVLVLQNAARQHLAQGQAHEATAAAGLVSADSAARLALEAARAVQAARTAQDSIPPLLTEVGALNASQASLRVSVTEQERATAEALAAYRAVRIEADTTEHALKTLRVAAQAVVNSQTCRLLSWHPCIPHVRIGPYLGYQVVPKPNTSVGIAVVWSP